MTSIQERFFNGHGLYFPRNGEYSSVENFFLARGWNVNRGDNGILVPTIPQSVFNCGDERFKDGEVPEDHRYGPSFFGGALGIAALRREPTLDGVRRAALDISASGYRAGMHGDEEHDELGCGFNRLLLNGHFNGVVGTPAINLKTARHVLEEHGGSYVDLRGKHTAVGLNFNFVLGTTILPDGNGFGVDGWYPLTLAGVAPDRLLELTAETVEALKPDAKNVTIYT